MYTYLPVEGCYLLLSLMAASLQNCLPLPVSVFSLLHLTLETEHPSLREDERSYIPYSRKYWRGIIFGGLADSLSHHQY